MQMDNIIASIVGIGLMVFIYWFFLKRKDEAVMVEGSVEIIVDGGYNPAVVVIAKDKTTTLRFTRKDKSSCLEEIVIPEFKVRKFLPLNQTVSIELKPEKEGEYEFSCAMNMLHGKIIVK